MEPLHELSLSDSMPSPPREPDRLFMCNYCQRKFFSSQALGGHQNAHRLERSIVKRRSLMGGIPFVPRGGPGTYLVHPPEGAGNHGFTVELSRSEHHVGRFGSTSASETAGSVACEADSRHEKLDLSLKL